ncbi:MAG: hypothetical protein QM484_06595 [Woeseiaceae bacterium]
MTSKKIQSNFIIILVLFFLTPIKLIAMNDTTFDMKNIYYHVKDHKDLVNVLPDEAGTSFPVPVILKENNSIVIHMSFFHFYMGRINEKLYDISSPNHKTIVNYSDGSIIETFPVTSESLGVNWDDSISVGEYIPDPNVSYEQQIEKQKRFFVLYNLVLSLYINKDTLLNEDNKILVDEFKSIFYDISHPPLLPYYKSLNSDFFNWLEESTK